MYIFVFGSNESGIHGAGAAKYAAKHHGALHGVGFGHIGNSFAIPTMDWNIEKLPLKIVKLYAERFLAYAEVKGDLIFHLTKVGCGLAGFDEVDMANLFKRAPKNVVLINTDGSIRCDASMWYKNLEQSA